MSSKTYKNSFPIVWSTFSDAQMNLGTLQGCNLFLTLSHALADLFLSDLVPEE